MNTHPHIVPGFLVLAVSPLVTVPVAQAPPASPVLEHRAHSIPWPITGFEPGSFGRGVAGDVTGDLVPDAVVLSNGRPIVFSGPAQFGSALVVPTMATDVALLSLVPGPEVLATVGPAGLELWTVDAGASEAQRVAVDPAFAGARALRATDVDGAGPLDLVLLAADGRSVQALTVDPASPHAVTLLDSFALPPGAEDGLTLEALDWDGVGAPEVALLTANHLLVFDLAGNLRLDSTSLFAGTPMSMAIIDDVNDSRQRIAWMTVGIFTTPWIVLVGEVGAEGPVELGAFAATPPAAADYDGDGDSELFFGPEAADDGFMLTSFSEWSTLGAPTYVIDPQSPELNRRLPLRQASGAYGDRTDRPLVHDFDNDGDPDVLFIDEVLAEVRLVRGEAVNETELLYRATGGEFVVGCDGANGMLTLSFAPPATTPPDAYELELLVFERPSPTGEITAEAIHTDEVPLFGLDPLPPVTLEIPIPETEPDFSALYYIEVRVVSEDPATGARRAWPAYPLAFGVSHEGTLALETDPALGDELDLALEPCPPPDPSPGTKPGKAVGGGVAAPLPVIRPFREGELPAGG